MGRGVQTEIGSSSPRRFLLTESSPASHSRARGKGDQTKRGLAFLCRRCQGRLQPPRAAAISLWAKRLRRRGPGRREGAAPSALPLPCLCVKGKRRPLAAGRTAAAGGGKQPVATAGREAAPGGDEKDEGGLLANSSGESSSRPTRGRRHWGGSWARATERAGGRAGLFACLIHPPACHSLPRELRDSGPRSPFLHMLTHLKRFR